MSVKFRNEVDLTLQIIPAEEEVWEVCPGEYSRHLAQKAEIGRKKKVTFKQTFGSRFLRTQGITIMFEDNYR